MYKSEYLLTKSITEFKAMITTTTFKVRLLNLLFIVFVLTIMFHLLVLTGVIPFSGVWGGRLETVEDMYRFEIVSIAINLLVLVVLLQKRRNLLSGKSNKVINAVLWFFMGLFLLNTLGNLFAESIVERFLATPLTLLISVSIYLINRKK
jgi:hypothetical protein